MGALLEWSSGGWGGAGPAGWLSSMQHDSGSENESKPFNEVQNGTHIWVLMSLTALLT